MPEPISLCIENTEDTSDEAHFIRCVALEGNRAGLAIDPRGRPMWLDTDGCACELWVSADDQLILLRPQGAPASRVHRSGRSLDVPTGKPVVVLDQDEIEIQGVLLRLHVHGYTTVVHPPEPFVPPRAAAAALAVAMAFGAATGCDGQGAKQPDDGAMTAVTLEQTTEATTTTAAETTTATESATAESSTTTPTATAEATATATATTTRPIENKPPIEVRPRPPAPVRRDPPAGDPQGL